MLLFVVIDPFVIERRRLSSGWPILAALVTAGNWWDLRRCGDKRKGQSPVSRNFRAGGILDNKILLSHKNLFNFRATFSLVNKRTFARSQNSTDWKLAFKLASRLHFPANPSYFRFICTFQELHDTGLAC